MGKSIALVVLGVLLIAGGLASVFLSIIPSITNAVDAVTEVSNDPTAQNTVKAGIVVAWAVIVWWLTFGLTVLAFIGGFICLVFGASK